MVTLGTNRILAALPQEEITRLRPELERIDLALGDQVYESGGRLEYVCFPTSCIVSLIYTMENGAAAEMGLVGNDGMVGIALFMGGDTMRNRAVAQLGGSAIRMTAMTLQSEVLH